MKQLEELQKQVTTKKQEEQETMSLDKNRSITTSPIPKAEGFVWSDESDESEKLDSEAASES
jgi:hypothetical protein